MTMISARDAVDSIREARLQVKYVLAAIGKLPKTERAQYDYEEGKLTDMLATLNVLVVQITDINSSLVRKN